jgi:hypothetical protein
MKPVLVAMLCTVLLTARAVSGQEAETRDKGYWERAKEAFEQLDRKRAMEEVQRLYQQAKAAGDKVPADLLEWAREDLARAGRWEYKVLELDGDPDDMESSLNEHGRERWECLSLTREKKKWVAVLKRPMGSRLQRYFGNLGATDILRLLGG